MKKSILILFVLANLAFADLIRDDDKGVVIDTTTNLIWQDEAYTSAEATAYSGNTESGKVLNWSNAISYCENLTYGTYTDWHLPNFNELHTIVDRSTYNPAINNTFTNVSNSTYWSSTTTADDTTTAWIINFFNGTSHATVSKTVTRYVRCFRSADN